MPRNTRKAPAGFKAMTLKAAAVAWALATLSTSISPVSAQDPVLPASTITVVPTSTLSANSSTIQPSPTSAVIPPTASSVAPTLMPSSSLPRTQPSPSSSSPPGHSPQPDESGVPVAFELVAQTGYAVLTQTPACNATVVGIVVTWQTDAAASAASLNRNATLCASEPGVETRLIGSFSDVLSGALYVLYTAANTTMVSSVDTKTLEVTHLPPIDAAVGKIVSIAVLRPSPTTSRPGPNTPPSLALLAPSTGLWTIPLGTSPSVGNAYTRRVQFNPSQKVAVDMQVGDPFIFVLGINPQNGPEAFYLSKIDTRDFSEVDNSFSIPRASLMGPHLIDNDLDAATLVRKPLLLCDSTAYVVFTSPTSLGLTLLTFNTTRLEINKASGSVISSLDTLISVACIHGQPAPGGADFSGVAVVAEPFAGGLAFNASMDTTAPYVVTVDKDCKSSRSKAIPAPRGAATLTTSRSPMSRATQQEFSVASILSAERVQTLGLFRISTSDVRQWYVDVLPLSFLRDAIPGNETCQAGFVFSSLERMCVECRSVTPPPESCISVFPRAMDSFNWFEALNPLLKTSVVFGAFVFATLLVGTVMYYANRGGEDRNQRAELMSQQLKRSQAARTGQHVVPRPMQPKPHQAVEPPPRAAVADSAHMNQSSNNADIARSLGITETGSGSSSASGSSTHSPDCRGSNLMRQTGERRAGAGIRPAYAGNDMSRLVSEFDASLAKLSPLDHHNGISPNLHKTVNDGRDAQEYRNGAAERRHISLVTRTCSEASVAVQIETATPATTMPRPQPAQETAPAPAEASLLGVVTKNRPMGHMYRSEHSMPLLSESTHSNAPYPWDAMPSESSSFSQSPDISLLSARHAGAKRDIAPVSSTAPLAHTRHSSNGDDDDDEPLVRIIRRRPDGHATPGAAMPKNPAAPDEEQQPQPPSVTSAPHLGITNLATFTASTESVGQQSKDSQDSHDSQDSKESGATTQRSESPGILHSARAYLASRKQGSGRRQWFGNPFSASPTCTTPAQTQGAVHDQTLASQPSLALGNVHGAVEDLASPIANSPGKDVTSTHPVQPPVSAHAKSPSIDSVDSASMFGTVREAHASQPRALSMPSLYSRLSALPGYEGDSQAQGEEQPSETDLDVDPDRKQQYHHQQPAEQQAAVRTGVRVPPTRRLRQ